MATKKLEYVLDLNDKKFIKKLKDAGVDVSKLEKGLEKTGKTGNKSFSSMLSNVANLSLAFSGMIRVIKGVVSASKQYVDAFAIQEKAEQRVISLLGDNIKAYTDYATAIQAVTTVGDEQVLQLQALASSLGVAENKINDTVKQAIGLAKAFELAGLSQELALKGLAGNITLLTRYIPALKDANTELEKQEILQKAAADGFRIATDEAKTATGQLEQLKNISGDLDEAIGENLTPTIIEFEESLIRVKDIVVDLLKTRVAFGDFLDNIDSKLGFAKKESLGLGDALDEAFKKGIIPLREYVRTLSGDDLQSSLKFINESLTGFAATVQSETTNARLSFIRNILSSEDTNRALEVYAKKTKKAFESAGGAVETFVDTEESDEALEARIEKEDALRIAQDTTGASILERIRAEIKAEEEASKQKIQNILDIDEVEKSAFDAQIERSRELREERIKQLQDYARLAQASLGTLFDSWAKEGDDLWKSLGRASQQTILGILDMYAKAEIAKLTFSSFSTFGASLLGILPIIAALEAAKSGISAITFTDGGGMTTGPSHAQGGTKFVTKSQPGVIKEYEGSEYILSGATTARIGKANLDAMNFGGSPAFANGGLTTITQPAASNNQSQVIQGGTQIVEVRLDGEIIQKNVNSRNNLSRDSGQILTEST